jgi:hypothetical protein
METIHVFKDIDYAFIDDKYMVISHIGKSHIDSVENHGEKYFIFHGVSRKRSSFKTSVVREIK